MATQKRIVFDTAHELQRKLAEGQTTSVRLVHEFLDQIERHNHNGYHLNGVMTSRPRDQAIREAEKLDAERKAGDIRSPFHGIPILIKVISHVMKYPSYI